MNDPVRMELRPAGPGGTLRERLALAVAATVADVALPVAGVVAEVRPVPDARRNLQDL